MSFLSDMQKQIEYFDMDNEIRRRANSIGMFTNEYPDATWGDWKRWYRACQHEGRQIPPAEFKSWPEEKKREYDLVYNGKSTKNL